MLESIRDFWALIKFEHTIFALPFAYIGMVLAAGGWPTWHYVFWITVAMAAARTLAMGVNRIVDRVFDAQNPRTAGRPLVSGRVTLVTAWIGTVTAGIIVIVAAWRLGPLPLMLLPGALLFLIGYSFTKRFTWLSHFILGFTDGLAPLGAWVAVRGSLFTWLDLPAWILLGSVTFWIAGFDLIYACQDVTFDREIGLQAIPARFGITTALRLSTLCHLLTMVLLVFLGVWINGGYYILSTYYLHSPCCISLGYFYWLGMVVIAALLIYEHVLVKPRDLSHIDVAFFKVNSVISVVLFISVLGALR